MTKQPGVEDVVIAQRVSSVSRVGEKPKKYIVIKMCQTETEIQRVVITTHPQFSEAINEADDVAEFLLKHGIKVDIKYLEDDSLLKSVRAREFDLLITLGGDGTMLRAGHLCAPYDIPILGINHGRFGFLIEVAKDCWRESLTGLFSGGFSC
jgi:NAD+ kinase